MRTSGEVLAGRGGPIKRSAGTVLRGRVPPQAEHSARHVYPGMSTIERLCAGALVEAERRINARTAARLDSLLSEDTDGRISRFIWLRQFEVGKNSADVNRLLDRLEFLQAIELSPAVLDDIPAHRITRLRRQGERYFTDGLGDISGDRRLAILAVCVVEWGAAGMQVWAFACGIWILTVCLLLLLLWNRLKSVLQKRSNEGGSRPQLT